VQENKSKLQICEEINISMKSTYLDFEKPIVELERKLEDLRSGFAIYDNVEASEDIARLEKKLKKLKKETFSNLTPMQRVRLARHPRRPYTLDYVSLVFTDFLEMHGDRLFSDDRAIVGGWCKIEGDPVMVIGHQKGRDTKQNLYRNFGMPHPEGYRKALRLMKIAEKFGRPVITLIDTPGAYPGIGAEERGQSEAIARNLKEMALLKVPFIAVIIGEGGSGGALAMALGDRVLMLENSIYSVISPEGCASILYKDASKKELAANALKITSTDLFELKLIDEIVPEPEGGAHNDYEGMAAILKERLIKHLNDLIGIDPQELIANKLEKYSRMGEFDGE